MAKRRKRLKQKVLTYGELERRYVRTIKRRRAETTPSLPATLYGWVSVEKTALNAPSLCIKWIGNLRRAGGPDKHGSVVLARVFAMSDGDTGYVVQGVGKSRNNTPEDLAMLKVWRRYVGVFTPHDPKHRLTQGMSVGYRVRDGKFSRCEVPNPTFRWPMPTGIWWTMPGHSSLLQPAEWTRGYGNEFSSFPKFVARSKRFVCDLRKRLADGPTAVVQLLYANEGHGFGVVGLHLHVCLPPSRTHDGKRLIVAAAMHNKDSYAHFGITRDWGVRHSQYFAWQQGDPSHQFKRWKCGKDALDGIAEWVLSSIHIPGPE